MNEVMCQNCGHWSECEHCGSCVLCSENEIDKKDERIAALEAKVEQWIPVTEKLPGLYSRFLVYDPAGNPEDGPPVYIGRMSKSWGIARESENGRNADITHWMPITPPQESE